MTVPRVPVDTSANLVEQQVPRVRTEVGTLTASFTPKVESPRYIPKSGIDAHTQIEEYGLIFDFDEEVKPLVDIIVDKTLEQCLVELTQEMEMSNITQKLDTFRRHKHQAILEEAAVERKAIEDLRKKEQVYAEALERDTKLRRLAEILQCYYSRLSAKGGIVDSAFQRLFSVLANERRMREDVAGYVQERLIQERVRDALEANKTARVLTDELIHQVLLKYAPNQKNKMVDYINIFLEGEELLGQERVGPIPLPISAGIAEAEQIVQSWVEEHLSSTIIPPVGGYMRLAQGYLAESSITGDASVHSGVEPSVGKSEKTDLSIPDDSLSVPSTT